MSDTLRRDRALELIASFAEDGREVRDPERRLDDLGFDSLTFAELDAAAGRDLGVDLGRAHIPLDATVADLLREIDAAGPSRRADAPPAGLGRLQATADALGGWAFRWWFDLRVFGADAIPRSGPAVVAMNHESALDIPITVVACPRRITFMAKKELFKNAFVSWSLHAMGGFRVDRDRFDMGAVRLALAAIANGDILGVYPEGTRSPGEMLPFLHGAAWIALRSGAPLIPCAISGTERAGTATRPGRVRVEVSFAPPIAVERIDDPIVRRDRVVGLTAELRQAIASLLP